MGTKNNFTQQENTTKILYKLRIYYRKEFVNEKLPESKMYYSYDKPNNSEYGKQRLLQMLSARKEKVRYAILYCNQTNVELQRYNYVN